MESLTKVDNHQYTSRSTRFLSRINHICWGSYRSAWSDLQESVLAITDPDTGRSSLKTWMYSLIGLLLCWQLYVPVHELLHVAGCILGGGTVTELSLSPLYGGTILSSLFPYITTESEYAGRLSGFDTGGSDLCYLLTVFLPYTLSIALGVTLLFHARDRKNPLLLGVALIFAATPFMSLTGDYLELGSIIYTRMIRSGSLLVGTMPRLDLDAFRSDDLFRLLDDLIHKPDSFGIHTNSDRLMAGIIVGFSQFFGVLLAGWTYGLSRLLATTLRRIDSKRS